MVDIQSKSNNIAEKKIFGLDEDLSPFSPYTPSTEPGLTNVRFKQSAKTVNIAREVQELDKIDLNQKEYNAKKEYQNIFSKNTSAKELNDLQNLFENL